MSDPIEREDAIKTLKASYVHEDGIHLWRDHNNDCIDKLIDKFKSIPSAERKGEWIYTNDPLRLNDEWACSRCGNISFVRTNFCDRCGCRMKGAEDE